MLSNKKTERVSLWSVLSKYWNSFIWILFIFLIIWTVAFALSYDFDRALHRMREDISANASPNASVTPFRQKAPLAVALVSMKDYATYTLPVVTMLAITFVLIEDGKENLELTITRWLREKVEEEQLEKARSEGVAEGLDQGAARNHAAWLVWYDKFKEAQEKGEPFDEPPPKLWPELDMKSLAMTLDLIDDSEVIQKRKAYHRHVWTEVIDSL